MGDKMLEQVIILTQKYHFFRPMYYASPIENSFYLGRALADLTDRHYALFANNQHPMQLEVYNDYNMYLRNLHSESNQGMKAQLDARVIELQAEKSKYLNTDEGESLSMDDFQDIYIQAKGEQRERYNFSLNTRTKNGDIADYLETRRPFGANE